MCFGVLMGVFVCVYVFVCLCVYKCCVCVVCVVRVVCVCVCVCVYGWRVGDTGWCVNANMVYNTLDWVRGCCMSPK